MGINCNMNEIVNKIDSTCDAKQFEEHIGTNTYKKQENEFSTMTSMIDDFEYDNYFDMAASTTNNNNNNNNKVAENDSNNNIGSNVINEEYMSSRNAMNNDQLVQFVKLALEQ